MIQPVDRGASGASLVEPNDRDHAASGRLGRFARGLAEPRGGRLLVVAPQPFYQDRGTPIAVRQVLQALSELGRQVDLLTYPVGADIEYPGLRIFRASNPVSYRTVPIGLSLRKLVLDVSLVAAMRTRLARERYAAIHAVEEAAFPAVLLGRQHGVPVLYDMQSSLPEQLSRLPGFRTGGARRMFERVERWLLRRSTLVVTSAGLASRVRATTPRVPVREWHFPSAPTHADRRSIEALRERLGIHPASPVVLYSGTFEVYQGLPELIGAIPAVRACCPRAVFVFVGAHGSSEVLAPAEALVSAGALRIVERQPRDEMPAFLGLADVLVSPRAYGGNLPLKIFDYLAAGRPIVATDIPTHRSVLSEDRAVLVPPSTPALAEGIISLLEDPARASRLGAAGRHYAATHLGWVRFRDSVDSLYAELERHALAGR
ncbi:MAG: glycosyltransferase family 4 protein [Gemmatimonadales bacterium]